MIGNLSPLDQRTGNSSLMRKNHNIKRGLIFIQLIDSNSPGGEKLWCNYIDVNMLTKWELFIVKGVFGIQVLLPRVPLFKGQHYFRFSLDRRFFFRLFSKRATLVAASLGRSGRSR